MSRALVASLVALACSLAPLSARADLAPPNTTGCNNKSSGDACKMDNGNTGTCSSQTCQHPTPDGSTSYSCLVCVGSDAGGDDGGSSDGGSTGGSSSHSGCAVGRAGRGFAFGIGVLSVAALAYAARRRKRD
jgi:hypothetical protein